MALAGFPSWRFLAGFVSEQEAWSYVSGQGIPLSPAEEEHFRASIRGAIAAVSKLKERKGVSPRIDPLPKVAATRISALEAEPSFKEYRQAGSTLEWGLVELGKIRCFQQNINLAYVEELQSKLPPLNDADALLKFCQPLQAERQLTALPVGFNPTTNTYTVVSENLDFRIQGNIGGQTQDSNGVPRSFVGFVFGFGLPQITVAEYAGKFILRNGYHRAFALLKQGHGSVPALIVHCTNYQATGGAVPGFLPPDLVLSDGAPILRDYLTPAAIDVPRRRMRVVVSVHAEAQVIGA